MRLSNSVSARATSAAPPYFKNFIKNETKSGYIDGALYHNNPVNVAQHERMLIWKDVSSQSPDILLSIGTGHDGHMDQDRAVSPSVFRSFSSGRSGKSALPPQPDVPLRPLTKFSTFTAQLLTTVTDRFDSILNCNKIWNDFRVNAVGQYTHDRRRFIRLNPDLGFKVPKLDEVRELGNIQKAASDHLKHNSRVKEIAHRLIASTFFFEKIEASTRENDGKYECEGMF